MSDDKPDDIFALKKSKKDDIDYFEKINQLFQEKVAEDLEDRETELVEGAKKTKYMF